MKSLPMLITVGRLLLAPVVAALILWAAHELYADRMLAGFIYTLAAILFIVAALSDWVDGWLARKYDAVTPLGAALDHCADKVLTTCALVTLAFAALPFHLVAAATILLARDVFVAGLREGLAQSGRAIPVGGLGKWKAAAEMAGVAMVLIHQAGALLFAPSRLLLGLNWIGAALIWLAALLACVSAFGYVRAALRPRGVL